MTRSKISIAVVALLAVGACESQVSRFNPVSKEAEPLLPKVAPPQVALTVAQTRNQNGQVVNLLVTGIGDQTIQALDMTQLGASLDVGVFEAVRAVGKDKLAGLHLDEALVGEYKLTALLPAGGSADRHVASGTNFPEHAEEASFFEVFNFPKFGQPLPAVTTVEHRPGVLLDYEVEICVRFDRDIKTIQDFDEAEKGFFLCADFTDRSTLLRMVDTDNFDSGSGFSDSKSREDFFPSGPFVVMPVDWAKFVNNERIMTQVADGVRQDARGGEMTMDFRQLTEKVLGDVTSTRFLYQGENHLLVHDKMIPKGAALMSGTAEGVIFRSPTGGDITAGVLEHIFTGKFLGDQSGYDTVIESFIEQELEGNRYLRVGEVVKYSSSSMGTIHVTVVDAE